MLLYITLGTNDLARAKLFYDAALAPLGYICHAADNDEIGYGPKDVSSNVRSCRLWITKPFLKLPATWGNGTMVALTAETRIQVQQFYDAALANGGTDEGAPGLRPYNDSFFACYVRDPDGNKLSAVCEKTA
jgi:catechol 2,3-dioxygenase-like lactoylglutathione lyase family enzyme